MRRKILGQFVLLICCVITHQLRAETFCSPGKPCIETTGLTSTQSFSVVEGGPTLGNGNKSWKIVCNGAATANRSGAQPTITITPQVDGDVLHLLNLFVLQAPPEGSGQDYVARTIRVVVTQSPEGAKFANVGEVIGFRSGIPGSADDRYCPIDLTIESVKQITGPDAKAPDNSSSWQDKCTINVSRVRRIATEPNGNAVIDVRTWRRDSLDDDGTGPDIIAINVRGDLTGRVYGGPDDNVTTLGSPRAAMRETRIGSIFCSGIIGKGSARPQDPDLLGALQIGQAGYAFLVEATTIDSIIGSTVNIYADTTIDQSTSLDRRITQIQATGARSATDASVAGIHGEVYADRIAPSGSLDAKIACDGDLTAKVRLGTRAGVNNGFLGKNTGLKAPTIVVGRSITSDAVIQTDAGGLQGQVIVNNQSVSGAAWAGPVTIAASTISHDAAGVYAPASVDYGGGAVGLVPFRLYTGDCLPISIHPSVGTPNTVLDSELLPLATSPFEATKRIRIAFYGPVRSTANASPLDIGIVVPDGTNSTYYSLLDRFKVIVKGHNTSKSGRFVEFEAASAGEILPSGLYVILPRTDAGAPSLVCDAPGSPAVQGFTAHYFLMKRDCNGNALADGDEIAGDPELDLNGDGLLDSCYDASFPCIADINQDCVVDDDDFILFNVAYNNLYDCTGDLNGDGVTDDADFPVFVDFYNNLECDGYACLEGMAMRCGY